MDCVEESVTRFGLHDIVIMIFVKLIYYSLLDGFHKQEVYLFSGSH